MQPRYPLVAFDEGGDAVRHDGDYFRVYPTGAFKAILTGGVNSKASALGTDVARSSRSPWKHSSDQRQISGRIGRLGTIRIQDEF